MLIQSLLKPFYPLRFVCGVDRITVPRLWRVALPLLVLYALGFVVTLVEGCLYLPGASLGFLDDYATSFLFLSFVLSLFFLAKLCVKFLSVFVLMPEEKGRSHGFLSAIDFKKDYRIFYQDYVSKKLEWVSLKNTTARIWFACVQLLIAGSFLYFSILKPPKPPAGELYWTFSAESFPISYIYNQIKDFIIYVLLLPSGLWVAVSIAVITFQLVRQVGRDDRLRVIPMSSDGAGGLKEVGDVSFLLFVIIAIQLLQLSANSLLLGMSLLHQIVYPLYISLAALVFFLPLQSAHDQMLVARQRELERIGSLCRRLYHDYGKAEKAADLQPRFVNDYLENFVKLRGLYKDIRRTPVWPYNFGTFAKFITLAVLPLIAYIANLITDSGSIVYHPEKLTQLARGIVAFFTGDTSGG